RRAALVLALVGVLIVGSLGAGADERRYTIAFANLTEEPGATLGATGFTGREVRESFVLAARRLPVDLVFYDNRRDSRTALDNAGDAVRRRVDLFIEYFHEPGANEAVARAFREARIPVLAINYPVGDAPLYAADNVTAGRIGGEALAEFGARAWRAGAWPMRRSSASAATDRSTVAPTTARRSIPAIAAVSSSAPSRSTSTATGMTCCR